VKASVEGRGDIDAVAADLVRNVQALADAVKAQAEEVALLRSELKTSVYDPTESSRTVGLWRPTLAATESRAERKARRALAELLSRDGAAAIAREVGARILTGVDLQSD
jgi:hypothetical protein